MHEIGKWLLSCVAPRPQLYIYNKGRAGHTGEKLNIKQISNVVPLLCGLMIFVI